MFADMSYCHVGPVPKPSKMLYAHQLEFVGGIRAFARFEVGRPDAAVAVLITLMVVVVHAPPPQRSIG